MLEHPFEILFNLEKKLYKSESLLKEAESLANLGYWELELTTGKLYWSDQIYCIFEIDKERFKENYDAFLKVIHPDDRPWVDKAYNDSLKNKTQYDIEHRLLMPDGRIKYVHEKCTTDYDSSGNPIRSIGVVQDITDKKLINNSIEKQKNFLSAILNSTQAGIMIINPKNYKIIDINESALKMLGMSRSSVIGSVCRHIIGLSQHDKCPITADLKEIVNEERELIHSSGERIPILKSAKTVEILGEPYLIESFVDIRKQKRIEDELKASRVAAESANESKSRFLANMSHEIRTPIHGIIGFLDILDNTILSEEQRDLLKDVKSSSKILLYLINDILDFSKIEADKLEIENVAFELYPFLDECISFIHPKAMEKNIKVTISISPKVPNYIKGDPIRLRQIINNLLSNAIKFTEHGQIQFKIKLIKETEELSTILFKVRDTGIGIEAEKLSNLFNPFVQADDSTTRKYGGTGLGLAISKKLVELMGGEIYVRSKYGYGSIFYFYINLSKNKSVNKLDLANVPAKEFSNHNASNAIVENPIKPIILLVEDNEINKKLLVKALNKNGYDCDTAENGKRALELMDVKIYDIVLMDCQMPEMDGYEATQRIRKLVNENRTSVVIGVTANALSGDKDKCIAAGMDYYLSKPIDMQELFSLIKKNSKIL